MKILCTICTETITENFAATPCGHTFHYTCLQQWVTPNKTCPSCREKCLVKHIVKLFIDCSDPLTANIEDLSPEDVKEKISLQGNLLKHKDKALEDAKASLLEVQELLKTWEVQYASADKKLKAERATCSTLKKQLTVMQHQCDQAKSAQKEAEKLKTELVALRGVNTVRRGTSEEVEELLKAYSSSQLVTLVTSLKGDYDVLCQKKNTLQKDRDKLAQDVSSLKKKLRSKEFELGDCQKRLSTAECDVKHFEQENNNLHQKVEMLCKAAESPSSKLALTRILESPMPQKEDHNIMCSTSRTVDEDIGASPLLTSHSKSRTNFEVDVDVNGLKRSRSDISGIVLPVKKFKKLDSLENNTSGFNGMGGQSKFVWTKAAKLPKKESFTSKLTSKPFAPRKAPSKLTNQPKISF